MKKQFIFALSFFTIIVMACEEINPRVNYPSEPDNWPIVTAFNPEAAECGAEITIYGGNFGASVPENFVTFDSWGSEIHSGRIAEVTQVIQPGVLMVRVPMHLVPGDYSISLQAKGNSHQSEMIFKITDN